MDEKQRGIIIGSLIILIGVLILLSNLDLLNISEEIAVGGIFLLIGIVFISFFLNETRKFAFLILGGIFCTLGLTIVMLSLRMIPYYYRDGLSGMTFILGVGTVFLSIFLLKRQQIWSLLFAGIFYSIAGTIGFATFGSFEGGNLFAIFLAGLGITFGIIFVYDYEGKTTQWAKYPAIVFIALSVLTLYLNNRDMMIARLILPAILILVGAYFLYQGAKPRSNT